MSNRKKIEDNRLRLKKDPNVLQRGIASIKGSLPQGRAAYPTHDEMIANPEVINMPTDESEVVKTVPAKHKGVEVGIAHLHDDGTVAIEFSPDAPQWAIDEINASAGAIGYDLSTGGFNGSS